MQLTAVVDSVLMLWWVARWSTDCVSSLISTWRTAHHVFVICFAVVWCLLFFVLRLLQAELWAS